MTRQAYYTCWDGICCACGHSYFECRGICTCLSCKAQRLGEDRAGLRFDEDREDTRDRRRTTLRLRVTPTEHQQIVGGAEADGQTISQYIRRRLGL